MIIKELQITIELCHPGSGDEHLYELRMQVNTVGEQRAKTSVFLSESDLMFEGIFDRCLRLAAMELKDHVKKARAAGEP